MAYPNTVDELTDGVPADGIAATAPLGSGTYPHDDHHRALGVAVEAIETQIVGAYTSYTPTLTSTGTAVNLGTGGTTAGYYKRLGRRVEGYAVITFGSSGTAAGTGYYGLLLPVEPANRIQPVGIGFAYDDSDQYRFVVATASVIPALLAAATSKAVLLASNDAGQGFANGYNPIGAAVPFAWSANDQLAITFSYEAAAAS